MERVKRKISLGWTQTRLVLGPVNRWRREFQVMLEKRSYEVEEGELETVEEKDAASLHSVIQSNQSELDLFHLPSVPSAALHLSFSTAVYRAVTVATTCTAI